MARCAIVRGVWRGMLTSPLLSLQHPCKSPASAALGAAGLAARLAKHDDATRSSRHVCHAPTLSAAKKRRLGSGVSAAVVPQANGPKACPVALCIHAERHGMRSFVSSKSLVKRPRASIHKALLFRRFVGPFKCFKSTAPSPFSRDHVLTFPPSSHFSRISASAAPFSKYP